VDSRTEDKGGKRAMIHRSKKPGPSGGGPWPRLCCRDHAAVPLSAFLGAATSTTSVLARPATFDGCWTRLSSSIRNCFLLPSPQATSSRTTDTPASLACVCAASSVRPPALPSLSAPILSCRTWPPGPTMSAIPCSCAPLVCPSGPWLTFLGGIRCIGIAWKSAWDATVLSAPPYVRPNPRTLAGR
jgi:hypothetical protein